MKNYKNILAIYGGAFNPPTKGHEFVIKSVLAKTSIEKIILSPDGLRADKDYKIEHYHRENMIEMFVEYLANCGIDIEIDKHFFSGKNCRDTTIMQVKDYYKDKLGFEPCFIFGSDVINAMPNWKENVGQYIEKKLAKIFIERSGSRYDLTGFDNYKIIETGLVNISSTKVKECLKNNKQQVSELIIPNIRNYIIRNDLYI